MSHVSDRTLYWSEILAKQRASGLSAVQWCRNEAISYNSFAGWRTRLNKCKIRSNPVLRHFRCSFE